MVYGTYNSSYWGESKPTNMTWPGHEKVRGASLSPSITTVAEAPEI